MTILYFSWVRSQIGREIETAVPPAGIATLGQLREWLLTLGPAYASALGAGLPVRASVNQEIAPPDHPVRDGDEVAFFPLFSGG